MGRRLRGGAERGPGPSDRRLRFLARRRRCDRAVRTREAAALLDRLGAHDDAAYVVRCACDPSPDGTGGDTVVDHIRLFPLREGLRWTYRVHEQILPALRRFKIPVHWTDITVRHTGYVDQALRGRKLERDTRILRAELDERPDDPFVLFNLGAIAVERKDWTDALGYLERSLAARRRPIRSCASSMP